MMDLDRMESGTSGRSGPVYVHVVETTHPADVSYHCNSYGPSALSSKEPLWVTRARDE